MKTVTIIDYGNGNPNSIKTALKAFPVNVIYSSRTTDILKSDYIILPGVGHFSTAMDDLYKSETIETLKKACLLNGTPTLGICLGMQLMTKFSEEGQSDGLGWINFTTRRIQPNNKIIYKVPHVGWNLVKDKGRCKILRNIDVDNNPFYFCHSFAVLPTEEISTIATVDYESEYVAVYEKNNLFGVQFHPEKSQDVGHQLFNNFLSI